jgi:hypothetical protein
MPAPAMVIDAIDSSHPSELKGVIEAVSRKAQNVFQLPRKRY